MGVFTGHIEGLFERVVLFDETGVPRLRSWREVDMFLRILSLRWATGRGMGAYSDLTPSDCLSRLECQLRRVELELIVHFDQVSVALIRWGCRLLRGRHFRRRSGCTRSGGRDWFDVFDYRWGARWIPSHSVHRYRKPQVLVPPRRSP